MFLGLGFTVIVLGLVFMVTVFSSFGVRVFLGLGSG